MKILGTPLEAQFVQMIAQAFANDPELRQDAVGNAAFLARELEYVAAQTYDIVYNPTIGRQIVPMNTAVDPGAETYSYDSFDQVGMAEWVTNYGNQPPRADAFKTRTTAKLFSFWSSYAYTIQDLRASAMGRTPLDVKRAQIARQVMERFLDGVIAVGDTDRAIKGLVNNTDIPAVATTAGTWATATNAAIAEDLVKLTLQPEQATAGLFKANTLLLPLNKKPKLSNPYSTTFPDSILKVWQNGSEVSRIVFWDKLNTASAIGGPRAMAIAVNPMVLEFILAADYEDFPPETKNLETQVICHMRVGGLSLRYALACAKMDLDA